MSGVSRTHRVDLDWLFDQINLDRKIQIKYIDTKTQLADILTKGNFTRDEWNHFLCLFNCEQHTSHVTFFVDTHLMTRTCVAQAQVWRAQRTFHIISWVISMRSCCVFDSPRLLHFPLLAVYLLSYRTVFPPGHQLLLPRCGGQIPCALLVMRTLAPLPSTTLSQVMSPTTNTSRRPLKPSSRSPPATLGPRTCMTRRSVTTPPAWRSLLHCSPRSEKMMRAVDELITFMTKVCRPVSRRRLSVIERGDPLWNSLIHWSQTSEKIRAAAQKMSKSRFFWNDKESRFSLTVKHRFKNTSSRPIMTEEVFKNWMESSSLKEEKFIVLIRRRTTSTRSTISSWTIIGTKSGSSWSSWEKSQWDGRIEAISRFNIRHNCEEKIGRRSRYYPWTYRQDSGITEWN